MADFVTIFMLSIAMFFGCGLAGWIPMAFSLSQRSVQLLTIFGAGLLVGTALVVIIPEGVDTMYNHPKQASELMQVKEMSLVENANNIIISSPEVGDDDQAKAEAIKKHHDDDDGPHHAVGISLLLGFVFMLLVDQIGGKSHAHVHAPEIRLDELNQSKVGTSRSLTPDAKSKGHTATIGLVVHAAADGIALGAAASTDRHDLQLIVFLAIMLHKAPAAFGLTSFLIHEGLEPRRVKKHLLAFALAAPLLAILTFLFLNQNDRQWLVEANATGIAMLFSAGTFLYVATVHVLPEVASSHGGAGGKNQLSLFEVFVLVAGTLCPLLLNLGHSHGHHG